MSRPADAESRYETVTDAGAHAPWLTLVHAFAQDRRVFSAQVAEFRGVYRLMLVDLPGHGRSTAMPGPYGLREYAAGVDAALRAAGIERTHYGGTHTGAGVGLLLACEAPARFASLVLEGPVIPGRLPPAVAESLAHLGRIAREQGLEAARRQWWEQSGWFAAMRERPEVCRATEQRALIADFAGAPWLETRAPVPIDLSDAQLAALRVPILILNGEHDMPDFLQVADELAELLPHVRRATIPEAGGFPLWELPERTNAEVRRFLAEIDARHAPPRA